MKALTIAPGRLACWRHYEQTTEAFKRGGDDIKVVIDFTQ